MKVVSGRKTTGGEQFQVAQVAHGDLDGRQFGSACEQFFTFPAFDDQVHEFSPVGGDEFCFRHLVLQVFIVQWHPIKRRSHASLRRFKHKGVLYSKIHRLNFGVTFCKVDFTS